MFEAPKSAYLVPFDGSFKVAEASTAPQTDGKPHKGKHRRQRTEDLNKLQRVLAAGDKHSILLVFQAMDAAGKDSTIRSVMQGVDPSGCQVFSFKKPSNLELDHDFLWRTTCRLPERGRIGIFNRSQYEEVLVVRVHPKILGYQKLPGEIDMDYRLGRSPDVNSPAGRTSRSQWHSDSQVLAQRLQGRTEAPFPVTSRRRRKELEIRT